MEKIFDIAIVRPAGNEQLLINGTVIKCKKLINDLMISKFPDVEQVSFYQFNKIENVAQLELAGGEFCGNATRSLAYLLLKGKIGTIDIHVSGTTQVLKCGIKKSGTAFAQMPILSNFNCVKKISKDVFRVDLEGITHIIYNKPTKNKTKQQLLAMAKSILYKENLIYSSPASGVMFIEKLADLILLKPVVWVRDIETLLYETACASGTTAVGLWLSMENNIYAIQRKIMQPSGKFISISIEKNDIQFLYAYIDGPIEIIKDFF